MAKNNLIEVQLLTYSWKILSEQINKDHMYQEINHEVKRHCAKLINEYLLLIPLINELTLSNLNYTKREDVTHNFRLRFLGPSFYD